MKTVLAQYKNWLLPAVLILFILQAVTFPFALGQSWAGRSETPDHLLTFNMRGRLVWDSETEVDDNGVAQLNLFASKYGDPVTVDSGEDGSKLVAPGTGKQTMIRLYNRFVKPIFFKVVLYQYQENIPEDINMRDKLQTRLLDAIDGRGFADDTKPVLPEGVTEDQVIRAVTGKISAQKYQDFDINWLWDFEAEGKDADDTLLGSLAAEGKGRTTLMVAHRISTVADADKIVYIEDGSVAAIGTHDELYERCPAYRRTVDLQKLEDEGKDYANA